MISRLSLSLFIIATLAACKTAPPVAVESEGPVIGPPQVAWESLTKQQKGRYMKEVVMPEIAPLFTAFDPHEFEKVTCGTCHGPNAKENGYEMPSPALTELPSTQEGWDALSAEKPEAMKFMSEQVRPTMAALLGMHDFDPAKPEAGGFGCTGCHTMEKTE